MESREALDQIIGMLFREDCEFKMHDGGTQVGIDYPKTIVFVTAEEWRGGTVIKLSGDVVMCLDLSPENKAGIYFWINQRNAEQGVVKVVLEERVRNPERDHPHASITTEIALMSDFTADQFFWALREVSFQAEALADPVKQIFGGETRADVRAEHRERFGPELGDDDGSSEGPFA
jgi:hypothetical protein